MGSYIGVWKTAARKTGQADAVAYLAQRDAGQKWCRGCRAWHDRAAFAADRSRADGLTSACRTSRNARERALYAKRSVTARRPAPIYRGEPSRIEGLTLVDLPRVFLTSLRIRDRYYDDVVRREPVDPERA